MALTNAEKQKRWREKRNERANVLTGKPKEIADNLLREFGPDQTRKIARALEKRLRNLRADCPHCAGTGFVLMHYTTACGMPLGDERLPHNCETGEIDIYR
jgi:hypothetical protein